MPGGALGRSTALRHVQRVHTVVCVIPRHVHGHSPHVVERGVEWQPCAHPQIHVRPEVVARCPEVVLIVAWNDRNNDISYGMTRYFILNCVILLPAFVRYVVIESAFSFVSKDASCRPNDLK